MKTLLITMPLLAAVPATAARPPSPTPYTEKVSTLIVYGNDPCPTGAADEIIVCARQPESERYRIPKSLRAKPYNAARDGSWAGTAKVLDYVSRESMPGSCSSSGAWGQTGCYQQFLEQNQAPVNPPPQ